ncbi:MAG: WbqC family protein, partial [Acidimicrobiia bacterium]|nr:WbqC family protein [Acidimicrobiia bacterium]
MIAAIHQPNFLPWLGYFRKLAKADHFVFLDTVPFSKGSYTNRVRVRRPEEPAWLTVPVATAGKLGQPITDVQCSTHVDWRSRIRGGLQASYQSAPHYQPYADEIADILTTAGDMLSEVNVRLIAYLAERLGIETPTVRSSELPAEGASTELLIGLCRHLGATAYLSGSGGRSYQDESAFVAAGIEVRYLDHP